MEIRNYVAILWRRKWIIAATTAVTLIVAVVGTLMATPTYVASTTLRVLTASTGSVGWTDYDIVYANRLMNTYVEIATSRPVLEELLTRLDLDKPPQIEVEVLANTELMRITVEDPNPILVQEAANVLAEILVAQSRELYAGGGKTAQEILGQQLTQIEGELDQARREHESLVSQSPQDAERIAAISRSIELKQQTYATLLENYEQVRIREALQANTISVVDPAAVPQAPSKPHKKLSVALGLMVGLAGGVGLVFLFENLDSTLYTTEQIEQVSGLTALGKIATAEKQQQITFFNGNSPQAEAFRRLRTNILNLDYDIPLQTLLITSAEPREGKSTIVANLALAMARSGCRIIVVDGDLRLPTLHKIFGLSNEMGLSNILKQEATLDEAVQEGQVPGVWVLTSGASPPNPAELLGSSQMTSLIEQLARQFDVVLVDAPSLIAVTDPAVLAPTVDGVLLVVGRAQARRETVRAACQHLADVRAKSIGVVVNRAEQDDGYYYYHQTSTRRDG
jgi:capsular exopolysaccharide synthesis family protein